MRRSRFRREVGAARSWTSLSLALNGRLRAKRGRGAIWVALGPRWPFIRQFRRKRRVCWVFGAGGGGGNVYQVYIITEIGIISPTAGAR